jgi:hypothetical protein
MPIRRLAATVALSLIPSLAAAQLRGSYASVARQHRVAERNDFTFLRTAADVRRFVDAARLKRVTSGKHVVVKNVAFPFARPQVKLFIERLAAQFHAATGERLVVTSLTRPLSRQPSNASDLSVHPTGMAVDLHIPKKAASRRWLERLLASLEKSAVLDATLEFRPAHYHVAVFPRRYEQYVEKLSDGG